VVLAKEAQAALAKLRWRNDQTDEQRLAFLNEAEQWWQRCPDIAQRHLPPLEFLVRERAQLEGQKVK
jgi:hypothetical protein